MLESDENNVQFIDVNPNVARTSAPIDSLLQMAAQNGGKKFNIFVMSSVSSTIPKRDLRAVQAEFIAKTEHF